MAWVTPRNWTDGELVTAVIMNSAVRDNLNALRDYFIGAQDLGASWLVAGGRDIQMKSPSMAHGMTSLVPTDYFALMRLNGGLEVYGFSQSAAQPGLRLRATIGNAAPSVGAIEFYADKKNGTGAQALASTDILAQFSDAGTIGAVVYGDGGINIRTGGLNVGFTAVPTAARVSVGDTSNYWQLDSGVVYNVVDSTDYINYNRGSDVWGWVIGNVTQLTLSASAMVLTPGVFSIGTTPATTGAIRVNSSGSLVARNAANSGNITLIGLSVDIVAIGAGATDILWSKPLVALGGGAAPTLGTVGGSGPTTAAQNSWMRVLDSTAGAFWVPVWK